jgi:hypothetical protein
VIINQWRDVTNLPCTNGAEGVPCYHNLEDILQLVGFKEVK